MANNIRRFPSKVWAKRNTPDLKVEITVFFTDMKIAETNVNFVRYDNADENKSFEQDCNANGFGIKIEFTLCKTTC
jgi:hypothetical protein